MLVSRSHFVALILLLAAPVWGQGGQGGGAQGGSGAGRQGASSKSLAELGEGDVGNFQHILTPGDRGEWPITARANETVILTATSVAFDPAIEIVDAAGKVVANNDDIEPGDQRARVVHRFVQPGEYKILVKGFKSVAGGQYVLEARRFVADEVAVGERFASASNQAGVKWVRFDAKAGATYTINSDFNWSRIGLWGPDGLVLEGSHIEPAKDGEHVLGVQTIGSTPGTIALTLRRAFEGKTTVDSTSQPRTLEEGGLDIWSLDAAAGDVVEVSVAANGPLPLVSVGRTPFRPIPQSMESGNRTTIVFASSSKRGSTKEVLFPVATQVKIYVSQPRELQTEYSLDVRRVAKSLPESGGSGSLRIGEAHYWRLSAKAGEILDVVGMSEAFDINLAVFSPVGEFLVENDDGGGGLDSRATFQAPEDGTYLVRVFCLGDGGSGAYSLAKSKTDVPRLMPDAIAKGALPVDGRNIWQVQGSAGQTILLSIRSTNFAPNARIVGPDGLTLAESDEGGGDWQTRLVRLSLPATGIYTIWVGGNGGGDYSIRWTDLG